VSGAAGTSWSINCTIICASLTLQTQSAIMQMKAVIQQST